MTKNKKGIIWLLLFVAVFWGLQQFALARDMSERILLATAQMIDKYNLNPAPYFKDKLSLEQENQLLKDQLKDLRFLQINNLALKQELAEINALTNKGEQNENGSELAEGYIVSLEPSVAPRTNFLLLRQLKNNIADGKYTVLAQGGFVLADTTAHAGSIKSAHLLSALGRSISARMLIKDKDGKDEKIKVVLSGKGAGRFEAQINKEYQVEVGDTLFYKNRPVAQIVEVVSEEQSPYHKVSASIPFNIDLLDKVLLLPYD